MDSSTEFITTITYSVMAKVIDMQDEACIEAIRIWAADNEVDDFLLMDEGKLKQVIKLGLAEYQRLYGDE